MHDNDITAKLLAQKYIDLHSVLNEKALRLWSASEARALGYGGILQVHKVTGISRPTIIKGLKELNNKENISGDRVRRKGGGRKKLTDKDSTLLADLDSLIEPATRGDPESPLRWSSKSTIKLAKELREQGHNVTQRTVHRLLSAQKYSMKSNRKSNEGGKSNPDRDEQFNFINSKVIEFQSKKFPVISVDTKKKENIGGFKNNGKEWSKKGRHTEVNVYDFIDKKLGKAAPYGVYDVTDNVGWVSVGISSDTAEFAVESIRSWWHEMGIKSYKNATNIMITADCGGSNGYRVRLWKYELQKLANEIGKSITVCHFPPGTSKWNKIEHRMFCHITENWRAKPLVDLETIIELIGHTTTQTGLKIMTKVDNKTYKKGRKISDEEFKLVNIEPMKFHGEWNYTVKPNSKK
ncbi:MAG: ISAzo13 family transposase [Candidatus Thermoplasmatota archaeon]|nr:ISAzo13 family transposase [Candidatus Thermoplasmatota archaeon]